MARNTKTNTRGGKGLSNQLQAPSLTGRSNGGKAPKGKTGGASGSRTSTGRSSQY